MPSSSLIPFHRVLIVTAILFCFGFAGWEVAAYLRTQRVGMLLLAIGFVAAGFALLFYLRHLRRFLNLPGDDQGPGTGPR